MPSADGKLESDKAVWDRLLAEEASSQGLAVSPQGFLAGANLQQHLEVVSGAAEAYAFETQRTAKKGHVKRGAAPRFAMKPHNLAEALDGQVLLHRSYFVEQVYITLAGGQMGRHI